MKLHVLTTLLSLLFLPNFDLATAEDLLNPQTIILDYINLFLWVSARFTNILAARYSFEQVPWTTHDLRLNCINLVNLEIQNSYQQRYGISRRERSLPSTITSFLLERNNRLSRLQEENHPVTIQSHAPDACQIFGKNLVTSLYDKIFVSDMMGRDFSFYSFDQQNPKHIAQINSKYTRIYLDMIYPIVLPWIQHIKEIPQYEVFSFFSLLYFCGKQLEQIRMVIDTLVSTFSNVAKEISLNNKSSIKGNKAVDSASNSLVSEWRHCSHDRTMFFHDRRWWSSWIKVFRLDYESTWKKLFSKSYGPKYLKGMDKETSVYAAIGVSLRMRIDNECILRIRDMIQAKMSLDEAPPRHEYNNNVFLGIQLLKAVSHAFAKSIVYVDDSAREAFCVKYIETIDCLSNQADNSVLYLFATEDKQVVPYQLDPNLVSVSALVSDD